MSAGNLNRVYKRVKKNKRADGVDGMGVDELLQYLKDNARNYGNPYWIGNTSQSQSGGQRFQRITERHEHWEFQQL